MKFNYEFNFDVDEFAEYIEEDFFKYTKERTFYRECDDKEWIADKLYDWCCDTSCLSIFIISMDIEDNTNKYYPQIVDKAYEILKKKYEEMKEFNRAKELKVHLMAIKEYCENRVGETQSNKCENCPLFDNCGRFISGWKL